MPTLQIAQPLSATAQPVHDDTGALSPVHLSTTSVGIRSSSPEDAALDVGGDVKLEYNGSPRITLYSRGDGTHRYSIRATNSADHAGGRNLVIRNESAQRDDLVLDENGNLKLEQNGSPRITLFSRGDGTHKYSIRVTNDKDRAGGRLFVIRNEITGVDALIINADNNVQVAGDITLAGADCAEQFNVADCGAESGSVMVIDTEDTLRQSTEPYDRRVAGVISGAATCRPGLILCGWGAGHLRLPLALSGTVFCKVDATSAPVDVGDLLTTSTCPGHAMKAADRERAFGAVIGKALRPLPQGFGLVPILVSLQ